MDSAICQRNTVRMWRQDQLWALLTVFRKGDTLTKRRWTTGDLSVEKTAHFASGFPGLVECSGFSLYAWIWGEPVHLLSEGTLWSLWLCCGSFFSLENLFVLLFSFFLSIFWFSEPYPSAWVIPTSAAQPFQAPTILQYPMDLKLLVLIRVCLSTAKTVWVGLENFFFPSV